MPFMCCGRPLTSVSVGTTVNRLALDLSKAFDKMNHHDLFIKLMDRNILANLLSLLENWFSLGVILRQMGVCCVKICGVIMRGSAGWSTLVPFHCDLYHQR